MHSPALGICWQFWRRIRLGAFAVAGYFLLTILVQLFAPMGAERQDDAGMMAIPLIWVAAAALSIFTYGHSEIDSRDSRFPSSLLYLMAGCVLAVPFARLAMAPLMLQWNRHR